MSEEAPLGTFEEQVMLAVLRTKGDAYGMVIRREIEDVTGREIAVGAVYATLDRLEAKRLVASSRGNVDSISRKIFRVMPAGAKVLAESKAMRERLWRGVDLKTLLSPSSAAS
jgi:PadR family transcriptional regulator PadR